MDTPTIFDDFLIGDDTAETIHALAGNDVIDGKGGNDQIFGDEGDDTIRFSGGWSDADTVDGGADVDTMDFQFVNFSLMSGGEPGDTATGYIYIDLLAGNYGRSVTFSPSGNFAVSIATVTNVENVIGSSGDDVITGNAADNVIDGGAGDDTMSGGDGNDTFRIEGGYFDADKIDGGNFADTLDASEVNYISFTPEDYTTYSFGAIIDLGGGKLGGFYKYTTPDASLAFGATFATITGVEHVIGSAGDDIITGNRAGNIIEGGAGNDTMSGGRGRDVFKFSGAYMDADIVDGGNDPVSADFDVLDFSAVDLTSLEGTLGEGSIAYLNVDLTAGQFGGVIEYDAGDAFIRFGNAATVKEVENVIGSAFDDRIKGSTGANRLEGGDGNDAIDSGGGADTLLGGKGNDVYTVQDGSAIIIEGIDEGTDLVRTITSGFRLADNVENLEIAGRRGSYKGFGNSLDNVITGLVSASGRLTTFKLDGGAGNDTLIGNNFGDELNGGTGNDTMIGGAGNDLYAVDSVDDEVVELDGGGNDTIVAVDLSSYTLGDFVENLLLVVAEGIADGAITGTGNELDNLMAGVTKDTSVRLFGNGGADEMRGSNLAGFSDLLDGGSGNDKLYGQAGNDILRGGEGADLLNGGAGLDTADYSLATSGITVDMTKGIEGLGGEALGDNFVGIENVTGSDHADTIKGNSAANTLKGGGGDDVLTGGGGKDNLDGGEGNDRLVVDNLDIVQGGAGDEDTAVADKSTVSKGWTFNVAGTGIENVEGNNGKDTINGSGVDWDLLILGGGGNDIITGGDSDDVIWGEAGKDIINGGAGFDQIFGGEGNDIITGGGSSGPFGDRIDGGAGNDTLTGTGNGYLFGDEGNDILIAGEFDWAIGGAGNDTITGGSGLQQIEGGAGNDILAGGAGGDFFEFRSDAGGSDTITDFELGLDKLRFFNIADLDSRDDFVITDVAGGALVSYSGTINGSITVLGTGVSASTLDADQFVFLIL